MLEVADSSQVADLAERHEDVIVLSEDDEDDGHEEVAEAQNVEQDVGVAELDVHATVLALDDLVEEVLVNDHIAELKDQDREKEENEPPLVGLVLVPMELPHLPQDVWSTNEHREADEAEYDYFADQVGLQLVFNVDDLELLPMEIGVLLDENDVGVDAEEFEDDVEELDQIEYTLQHFLLLDKACVGLPTVACLEQDLRYALACFHAYQEGDRYDFENDVQKHESREHGSELINDSQDYDKYFLDDQP